MNQEDIIRIAREAGIDEELPNVEVVYKSQWFSCTCEELERFFQAAYAAGAIAEREACAKVADECATWHGNAAETIAKTIRARGNQ